MGRSNKRVSRAFDEWSLSERQIRAFLVVGLRFTRNGYDRAWEEAGEEPWYEGGPEEPAEAFELKVEGLWPRDFEWMHLVAVVRDGVTLFEHYLTKALDEVLAHHGFQRDDINRAPSWGELRTSYRDLGAQIDRPEVVRVRDLRNFLVHHRGELRTQEQREKFAAEYDGLAPLVVELDEPAASGALDTLAYAVSEIDPRVYEHAWGGLRPPNLPQVGSDAAG